MHYQNRISQAKRLSQVHGDEDIAELSNAIFPGTHCPLFGALLAASYVKDLAVLNIGTQECTFYGKDFSRLRQKGKDAVFSLVTHKNDITFGIQEKVKAAVEEIIDEHQPNAILLISTCVVELIGEDILAIASEIEQEVAVPILAVKTEHFKCNSHMPGLSDTMRALSKLMIAKEKKPKTLNLLGHRFDGFHETELAQLLKKYGVEVHMSIPSACSTDQLKNAGEAAVNVVTDFTAISLAEEMAVKLGQPFVLFEKHLLPERILERYTHLGKLLDLSWDAEVGTLYEACKTEQALVKKSLEKATFIYGNAPVKALESAHFLSTLGMVPLWIQLREWYEDDSLYKDDLLRLGHDPKISRIANIVPMREVYDMMKPSFYIGHENPMELMRRGIRQVTFDQEASGLGFQLPHAFMKAMIEVKGGH